MKNKAYAILHVPSSSFLTYCTKKQKGSKNRKESVLRKLIDCDEYFDSVDFLLPTVIAGIGEGDDGPTYWDYYCFHNKFMTKKIALAILDKFLVFLKQIDSDGAVILKIKADQISIDEFEIIQV